MKEALKQMIQEKDIEKDGLEAVEWTEFFGSYYEFHLAMAKYMLFGDYPDLSTLGIGDGHRLWDKCIMRFFVHGTATLILEGLKMKSLRAMWPIRL